MASEQSKENTRACWALVRALQDEAVITEEPIDETLYDDTAALLTRGNASYDRSTQKAKPRIEQLSAEFQDLVTSMAKIKAIKVPDLHDPQRCVHLQAQLDATIDQLCKAFELQRGNESSPVGVYLTTDDEKRAHLAHFADPVDDESSLWRVADIVDALIQAGRELYDTKQQLQRAQAAEERLRATDYEKERQHLLGEIAKHKEQNKALQEENDDLHKRLDRFTEYSDDNACHGALDSFEQSEMMSCLATISKAASEDHDLPLTELSQMYRTIQLRPNSQTTEPRPLNCHLVDELNGRRLYPHLTAPAQNMRIVQYLALYFKDPTACHNSGIWDVIQLQAQLFADIRRTQAALPLLFPFARKGLSITANLRHLAFATFCQALASFVTEKSQVEELKEFVGRLWQTRVLSMVEEASIQRLLDFLNPDPAGPERRTNLNLPETLRKLYGDLEHPDEVCFVTKETR